MPQLPARSRLLWRYLSSSADGHGVVSMGRALSLSVALAGEYGPRDIEPLVAQGLIRRHNGGWLVGVSALTGEVFDHGEVAL